MAEGRVDILDHRTRQVLGHCYGPTLAGGCPGAGADGVVPCAGHLIASLAGGPEHWMVRVPPGSRRCPLAWEDTAAG